VTLNPEHLRLVDGGGIPVPGHLYPTTVRLRSEAVGACPYPLAAGVWYPVEGELRSLDGERRQWLVLLEPGQPGVPVDEYQLELGPDDPDGFARAAAEAADLQHPLR
jgi:hypothetical protein